MPCFFCIAVGAAVAAGVGSSVLEGIASALGKLATAGVTVTDDTVSTQRLELRVAVPKRSGKRELPGPAPADVPVAVTVYKKHGRVRIQVLTHDVDRVEAQRVQDVLAEAMGMTIVHRATDTEQHVVHEAVERLASGSSDGGPAGIAKIKDRLT
jgi:hypothetical protein